LIEKKNIQFKREKTMQKFLVLTIAVLITLGLVFLSSPIMADVETHDDVTISGTVPFCASWEMTEPDVTSFTDDVNITIYDANEVIITNLIQVTDFDCNTKFKITATKGTWTLPTDYHATDGAKKADGSDSDLLLMVDNITAGYASAGLAALGGYGGYTAIVTGGSDIIGGGNVGADVGHGVENSICDVNAKILMDWDTDIVGAYSIDVTLTITEVTE